MRNCCAVNAGTMTPKKHAELQAERRSKAVDALIWFDEAEIQGIVKEALALIKEGYREIASANGMDDLSLGPD